ncbi:JAB domain-containing protein [Tsuneonella amylolytica]|uniref:JAB domain-containing protein n=1 Tax=Tsuneonella amylolytica TaxID=2338327 RepID=UPI0013C4DF3B|nr:JAB domain-containing protein [Tsuneonella amylolytica]
MRALFPRLETDGARAALTDAFGRLAQTAREAFVFCLFDRTGRPICSFTRGGGAGSIELNFRDVIERALGNAAHGIVLVHNHPSGDPTPSADDIASTRMLAALCRPLELELHDHLIVAGDRIFSMRRAGLIEANRKAA